MIILTSFYLDMNTAMCFIGKQSTAQFKKNQTACAQQFSTDANCQTTELRLQEKKKYKQHTQTANSNIKTDQCNPSSSTQ